MKTYRFPARPSRSGTITVPSEIMDALDPDHEIEVLVLVSEGGESAPDDMEEERAWRQLGIEEFFKGYADSDAIYDDLK